MYACRTQTHVKTIAACNREKDRHKFAVSYLRQGFVIALVLVVGEVHHSHLLIEGVVCLHVVLPPELVPANCQVSRGSARSGQSYEAQTFVKDGRSNCLKCTHGNS